MKVGVTGAHGFLGWHIRARLHLAGVEAVGATRETFADDGLMDAFVHGCDVIVHVAGVNRASTDDEVADGNRWLASRLIEALDRAQSVAAVVYTNSTQSLRGGVYGEAKKVAAEIIGTRQKTAAAPFLDLILPHLFGEYGRPSYNSAVTTFAHALAVGETPEVNREGKLELLHAQDVAARVLSFLDEPLSGQEQMAGTSITVGDAWDLLQSLYTRYVDDFTIPRTDTHFELQMFNTLRSQLYLTGFYPRSLTLHADDRGAFTELARADGLGQSSFSTSVPGIVRGDHFHLDKVERFVVLEGEAVIRLRRVLTDEVATYEVCGTDPAFIDMPPLTTHNITNTGDTVVSTFFWAGDHFDPANPDTYIDPVEASV